MAKDLHGSWYWYWHCRIEIGIYYWIARSVRWIITPLAGLFPTALCKIAEITDTCIEIETDVTRTLKAVEDARQLTKDVEKLKKIS